jgi:hypothetical protein
MRDVGSGVRRLPSTARRLAGEVRAGRVAGLLPDGVAAELATSVRRVAAVRRPKDVVAAVEAEAGRLSRVVVPALAHHPLPVTAPGAASLLAAGTAALAAGFAEVDELALVVSNGVAAPTAVAAGAGLLGALVVEVWAAVSVRVRQLEDAGRAVDLDLLADEVAAALLRVDSAFTGQLVGRTTLAVGKRIGRRWAAGLVPVVGMFLDGAAAARTIRIVTAQPVERHPADPAPPPSGADA